jgi:two-component system chemotaxis response regulator CheB
MTRQWTGPIRALVVDDSAYNRRTISAMLASDPGIEVVDAATDGVDAVAKTVRYKPDVITLDLEMPVMDGFTFLRWLMKDQPTPVIVLSSRSERKDVFRALELGAIEFLAKPEARISRSIETLQSELVAAVHAVTRMEMKKVTSALKLLGHEKPALQHKRERAQRDAGPVEVVAIASSTGGPQALQAILSRLPEDLNAGIVIAQHMPPEFTKSFADRMNNLSGLTVREAANGDRVRPGTALIAPGGKNLMLRKERAALIAEIVPRDNTDKYIPSADRLMLSVADACGSSAMGVVLTGMGSDGARGALAIKQRQGYCIAESEESAVIYGMPQEAVRAGGIHKELPLAAIADEIVQRCGLGRKMLR